MELQQRRRQLASRTGRAETDRIRRQAAQDNQAATERAQAARTRVVAEQQKANAAETARAQAEQTTDQAIAARDEMAAQLRELTQAWEPTRPALRRRMTDQLVAADRGAGTTWPPYATR